MVEESESIGAVGAVSAADTTATYESLPGAASVPSGAVALSSTIASAPTSTASISDEASSDAPLAQIPSRQPNAQELAAVVKQANAHLASVNRVLELNVDAISGLTIATIRNAQTGKVLQQFPSPDFVHLAQIMAEWAPGKNVLLDLMA